MICRILATFLILLAVSAVLFAQEAPEAEDAEKETEHSDEKEQQQEKQKEEKQEEKVQAEQAAQIESIEGDCEIRVSQEADWTAASTGITLLEGSFVCTGFASKAVLVFPQDITVEVWSLTEIKIDEFFSSRKKLEAKLKMKIGSVKVTIEKGAIRSDFEVSTPNTTTGVRGTEFIVRSSYYGDTIEVLQDSVEVTDRAGTSIVVREGEKTDSDLKTDYECRKTDSARRPLPHGSTTEEQEFARDNRSFGPTAPTAILSSSNPDSDRQQQRPDKPDNRQEPTVAPEY